MTTPLSLQRTTVPASAPATAWSHVQQARKQQAASEAEAPADSLAMSTLKKQIAALKKQIAAQQQQLRELMADRSVPDEQKQTRARALQQSIGALQAGIGQLYQSLQKLLESEQQPASGSQIDTVV